MSLREEDIAIKITVHGKKKCSIRFARHQIFNLVVVRDKEGCGDILLKGFQGSFSGIYKCTHGYCKLQVCFQEQYFWTMNHKRNRLFQALESMYV